MIAPRPSVERFVRTVVRAEAARGDAGTDSHVAQRITVRLNQELEKLIGQAGFDILLARALVLARRRHPSVLGVTAGRGGTLNGLEGAAHDDEGQEEAATAIASHFIELLVTLIGEDLATRLVGDLWPAAKKEEGQK